MKVFDPLEIRKIYQPESNSSGEDNGQVTIIGGSKLFHGAPLFGLKVASRIVDMVFFATPEKSVGYVAEQIKSKLFSFIWVPWGDVDAYIAKSDAVLIGSGFMRFGSEKTKESNRNFADHEEGKETRKITERLLTKFPDKKWVIDAGSLQTMDAGWIPEGAVLTPNKKEFQMLFKANFPNFNLNEIEKTVEIMARKYKCTIVYKAPVSVVSDGQKTVQVQGGNAGLTKGGTGDVLAGLTVALLAKNDPFLAACSASYITKVTGDALLKTKGIYYNSDDLVDKIPEILNRLVNK